MLTWVVGDSIVANAGKNDDQLRGGGRTVWLGLSGARSAGLTGRLSRKLYRIRAPTTIIVHLGTNDILKISTKEICEKVLNNLTGIRNLLPHTRIIWSDIMIKLAYSDEDTPGGGLSSTRNVNKVAHRICRKQVKTNVHVITHSDMFNGRKRRINGRSIYKWDGTHPSLDFGSELFRERLSQALIFFNENPGSFSFPPGSAEADDNE